MSTAAIPVHVALVDQTESIDTTSLLTCAGALNEQVQADFTPIWGVRASVGAYPKANPPPTGTWQIIVQAQLDQPEALGYHTDLNNQPASFIELTEDWTVTASHELLEMLADPWGNRLHQAELPAGLELDFSQFGMVSAQGRVQYLLEVCDPCEAKSYPVGGVPMSDFLTPDWYRTAALGCDSYSHAGGCNAPRKVADGGYVSFANFGGEWFQVFNQEGNLTIQDIGRFDAEHASLREFTDYHARKYLKGF